ncbi:uracil-DNA glycosylase [Irpex lacteus]|nr:uracil-DNA glycosylase [Irpex lacteus]
MFSGAGSQPSAKKVKVEKSSSSTVQTSQRIAAAGTKGGQTLNSIPFSLSAYVEALSDTEKRLLALECDTMGKSWLKVLKDEITKPYFLKLKQFLWDQGVRGASDTPNNVKVYPAPQNIYSWSNLTPLGRVKVVIIGQDPYHGPKQAHGLSFSVPHGVAIPPSLRNIYKEIQNEYPEFTMPQHGNLTAWAQNGVLLLNTCLTVKANEAGSHSGKGWEEFTDKVVDVIDKYGGANLPSQGDVLAGHGRGIVFLAWGAWAAKRVAKLNKTKHLILTSAHPSPLSASRGFLGNGHFKKANEWLEAKYGQDGCVDWCTLGARE